MELAYIRMINKMKINIWVALIVLVVGLWDLYYAYNRYQEKKIAKRGSKADTISFAILGIIFTIGGIIMLFMR